MIRGLNYILYKEMLCACSFLGLEKNKGVRNVTEVTHYEWVNRLDRDEHFFSSHNETDWQAI